MTNTGKCPKCENIVSSVEVESIDVTVESESRWRGVAFICRNCSTVLSVGMDPITLKTDIVNEVLEGMGKN